MKRLKLYNDFSEILTMIKSCVTRSNDDISQTFSRGVEVKMSEFRLKSDNVHPCGTVVLSTMDTRIQTMLTPIRDANPQSGKIRKFGKYQNVANKCIKSSLMG